MSLENILRQHIVEENISSSSMNIYKYGGLDCPFPQKFEFSHHYIHVSFVEDIYPAGLSSGLQMEQIQEEVIKFDLDL